MSGHIILPEQAGEVLQLAEVSGVPAAAETGKRKLFMEADGLSEKNSAGMKSRVTPRAGRVLFVDDVHGDDAIAIREHPARAWKTIGAALAAAVSGDVVYILPGTYSLAAGITIPTGVAIRGASLKGVTIQMLGVTANTTLVTMGENSRLEDVALKLTSSGHFTLTGILFPGTTSATAKLRTATVAVDNSGAGAGASDVTGVLVQSTGTPGRETSAIRASMVTVNSVNGGTKRGILVNTSACNFHFRDTNVVCDGAGTGTFIGLETNIAGSLVNSETGYVRGSTADISETAGTIEIGGVDLHSANPNGKAFDTIRASSIMIFADDGALVGGASRYLRPGTGTASVNEIKVRVPRKAIVQKLNVRCVIGPGQGRTDTIVVRKNGVNTALTAALVDAATDATNDADAVTFAANDDLSVQVLTNVATGTTDLVVYLELY